VPSLAAEALRVAQGASTYVIKASNASGETAFGRPSGVNHLRIGALEIPTDADGGLWLHFRHIDTASFLPAWRVLAGEIPREQIAGRIMLIGTSAAGLVDLRATPLEQAVPGVSIHQQIIEHILAGHYLTRPDYAPALELVVILVLGTFLAVLFPLIPAQAAALVGLIVIAGLNGGAWYAFAQKGFLFDALYPSLCLFLLASFASFYLYRRTEVQRQEVRRAFGQYVSPAVVRELIAHPEKLSLGGEVRQLTLMFCDVRNFTKISEGLSAAALTSFINELLTPLSDIVMASGGTIDKYMGDAIMAFWNAPLEDGQHARHALEAASNIVAAMDKLNAGWAKRGLPPVMVGIGLNTGECCVGNLGSSQRFDYSVIGDEVNIASRFEGLTKLYGLSLVTGEQTVAGARDMPFLELDLVRVKGRAQPSRIFTLLSTLGLDAKSDVALKAAQAQMLDSYRKREWESADAAIAKARALGGPALSAYYDLFNARIATYKLSPPPPDWNGIFNATEK
jgi:adenylate cyclase